MTDPLIDPAAPPATPRHPRWLRGAASLGAVLLLAGPLVAPDLPRTFAGLFVAPVRAARPAAPSWLATDLHVATPFLGRQRAAATVHRASHVALGLFGLGSGGVERGVEIAGYQGKRVVIPNGIRNSPVTHAQKMYTYPSEWPYRNIDFSRMDERDDSSFYDMPRLVTHIDGGAVAAIRTFYDTVFRQAPQGEYAVLDTCSSWVSHYPREMKAKRVAITGINEQELQRNFQATDYSAKDLNKDPSLPYEDNTFDFVTNVVSIDYLTKPREIVTEFHRVTKPGGLAIISFSNRCFFTKAIRMWVADMNDGPGHCRIVATYFRFAPEGGWQNITCVDISANPGWSDPMWVVTAVKA